MTTEASAAPAAPAANPIAALVAQPVAPAAAAPAAPVAAAPAAPAAEPAPVAAAPVAYEKTGDAGLDMALGFIGKLGIGPEDAAMAAAINGDFSLLKAKLGGMGDNARGWEGFLALAEKSHVESEAKHNEKVKADKELIHQAVGGEQQWTEIQTWAAANAEPHEKEAVNLALKQGGLLAKITASWLAGQYAKASGTTVNPADPVKPGANSRPDAQGVLNAKDYANEVQALRAKLGYNMDSSQEYRALQARRAAGRAAGL